MNNAHSGLKTKDIIELAVAAIILAIAGYMIYTVLAPQGSSSSSSSQKTVTYVKVTPVNPDFSSTELSQLDDSTKVRDFYSPPDLSTGLNNPQPFGPLQ